MYKPRCSLPLLVVCVLLALSAASALSLGSLSRLWGRTRARTDVAADAAADVATAAGAAADAAVQLEDVEYPGMGTELEFVTFKLGCVVDGVVTTPALFNDGKKEVAVSKTLLAPGKVNLFKATWDLAGLSHYKPEARKDYKHHVHTLEVIAGPIPAYIGNQKLAASIFVKLANTIDETAKNEGTAWNAFDLKNKNLFVADTFEYVVKLSTVLKNFNAALTVGEEKLFRMTMVENTCPDLYVFVRPHSLSTGYDVHPQVNFGVKVAKLTSASLLDEFPDSKGKDVLGMTQPGISAWIGKQPEIAGLKTDKQVQGFFLLVKMYFMIAAYNEGEQELFMRKNTFGLLPKVQLQDLLRHFPEEQQVAIGKWENALSKKDFAAAVCEELEDEGIKKKCLSTGELKHKSLTVAFNQLKDWQKLQVSPDATVIDVFSIKGELTIVLETRTTCRIQDPWKLKRDQLWIFTYVGTPYWSFESERIEASTNYVRVLNGLSKQ